MAEAPRPTRILVIDDEESLRHAVGRGLRRAGFESVEVATGREGVERFAGGGFDAVLTDVRLPDLSGLDIVAILTEMDADVPVVVMTAYGSIDTALEVMRELRSIKPDVRIILMSGYERSRALQLEQPPTGFLQKPFRSEDLLDAVAKLRG